MKKHLLDLFDAAVLYMIYIFSGLIGQFLVLVFDAVWTALQFRDSRMLMDAELFGEHLAELLQSQTVFLLLVSNFAVLFLYWLAFLFRRDSLGDYAGLTAPRFLSVVGAVIAGVLLHFLVNGLISLLDIPVAMMEEYENEMTTFFDNTLFLVLFAALISAPIVEEVVFRGVLLRALQKALNTPFAIVISSALFAIAHGHPIQMAYSFVVGVLLCLVRIKSKNLWSAMVMHFAFNAANYLSFFDGWILTVGNVVLLAVMFFAAFFVACIGSEKHHRI